MRISIVIPAHNEADNIAEVIRRVEQEVAVDHELIVVNDHSEDPTFEIVKGLCRQFPRLKLVDNLQDRGFANAVRTGFSQAKEEAVVPVMGDLCDDLATIAKMADKISAGYDIVCGCRYTRGGSRKGGSRLKGFLSGAAGWSAHILLGIPTHDIANAFKMYRRAVIEQVKTEARGFEISMELPLKAYFANFSMTEIPTAWKERQKGVSSFKVFSLLPRYLKLYFWAIKQRIKGKPCRTCR